MEEKRLKQNFNLGSGEISAYHNDEEMEDQ